MGSPIQRKCQLFIISVRYWWESWDHDLCLVASAGSFPQSYPTSADTAPLPPAAAALSMSIPPFSQSHPVPSIKREIGRLGIYFGEPHATRASSLAPPQFRGTWQPNRPYSPRERGADDADAHRRPIAIYLNWKRDVKQVSALSRRLLSHQDAKM